MSSLNKVSDFISLSLPPALECEFFLHVGLWGLNMTRGKHPAYRHSGRSTVTLDNSEGGIAFEIPGGGETQE